MRRTRITMLLAAGLALLMSTAPGHTASAQEAVPIQVQLAEISPWSGPEQPLRIQLSVSNEGASDLRDMRIRLLAGPSIQTRSEFQQRIRQPGQTTLQLGSQELDGVVAQAGTEIRTPPVEFDLPGNLAPGRPGSVLPLRIFLEASNDTGRTGAALETQAVYLNGAVEKPLNAAMAIPLVEETHRRPDGIFSDDNLATQMAADGPLGAVVGALAEERALPVTLMVDALLVEEANAMAGNDWQLRPEDTDEVRTVAGSDPRSEAARSFLQSLRRAASRQGNELAAFPYANGDLTALTRHGLERTATEQVRRSREDLEAALGTSPERRLAWPHDGLVDEATLATLDTVGVDTFVIDEELLPQTGTTTPNAPVRIGAGRTALVPDLSLTVALAAGETAPDPVVHAQQVIAETAVTWLERPGGEDPRGILLAPPQGWRPAPAAFAALAGGLANAPWIQAMTATELAERVPPSTDQTAPDRSAGDERQLGPYTQAMIDRELPTAYTRAIGSIQEQLGSFAATADEPEPALDRYRRHLAVAASSAYRDEGRRDRGATYIQTVSGRISEVYRNVSIQETAVTLLAQDGAIPVTVRNNNGQSLNVRLRLTSDRFNVPNPTSDPFRLGAESGTTRIRDVRTRYTGTFPVTAEILTADGRSRIAVTDLTVRSTIINTVTWFVIFGAGGFLVLWWTGKQLLKRRRSDATPPADATAPADATPPADGNDADNRRTVEPT